MEIRDIVISKKKARRLPLNNNLVRYSEDEIYPVKYPETFEGIIMSFADRHQFSRSLYEQVKKNWDAKKQFLKVE